MPWRRRGERETRVHRERAHGARGHRAGARGRVRSRRGAVLGGRAGRPGGARRGALGPRRRDRLHGGRRGARARGGLCAGGGALGRGQHGVAGAGGRSPAVGRARWCDGVRRELLDRREPVLPPRGSRRGVVPRHGVRRLHRGGAPRKDARRAVRQGPGAAPPAGGPPRARSTGGEHPSGPYSGGAPGGPRFGGGRRGRDSHHAFPGELRGGRTRRRPVARRLRKAWRVRFRRRAGSDPGSGKEGQAMTVRLDWLRGCGTALVTPFTADGRLDEARMRALVERQIAGGVKLLVPCGTTGEAVTLTPEEQTRVLLATVETARGRARGLAGVGSNSTALTIERAKAARAAGVDGVLGVAPYYNKPTQAGLIAPFKAVAGAPAGLSRGPPHPPGGPPPPTPRPPRRPA